MKRVRPADKAADTRPLRTFIDARCALLIAGLATFWALFDSCFFSMNLARFLGEAFADSTLLRAIGLSTSLIVSLLVVFAKDKASSILVRRGVFCASSLVSALTVFAFALPGVRVTPQAVIGLLVVAGLCSSVLMFSWMRLCAIEDRREGNRSAGLIVAASLALGGFVVILFSALQTRFIVFAVAVLPLLGIAFLHLYRAAAGDEYHGRCENEKRLRTIDESFTWAPYAKDSVATRLGVTWRLMVVLVIFSIATAMAQYYLPKGSDGPVYLEHIYSLSRYGFALIVFLGATLGSWKPSTVFRLGALIAIGAYLVMPFLPEGLTFISTVAMNAGYTCFELMVWTVLFESARLRDADALHVVGIGRAVMMGSALIGLALPLALQTLPIGAKGLSALATLFAYLLIIAIVLVLDESHAANSWYLLESALGRPFRTDDQETRCHILAQDVGLTPREYDVMVLLAAGRSAHYIAEKLSIAESTVNYHVRHIYEKCGVRTKQELIDKVDAVELA